MTATVRASIAIGTRIGPYEITGWLGAGGMGDVYRARDPRLKREVAIKVIPEVFAADPSRLQRFEQEARAAGQLNHPNILAVLDVGVDGGAPYIVSELLDGESLRSRLASGALPPRRALDYARQTADGLAAAHDRKIVHRDIKPDNLFVTSDGRIKILDFGIAKLTAPGDPGDNDARPADFKTETAPGTVVGTASYMSPEQVRGESVDHRSDLFSLGIVLHEMLTGRPAFTRDTGADTMAAILKEEPAEPIPAEVPPALARIVSRCLEKTREMRFQSARDLAFALDVLSGTGTPAKVLDVEHPGWLHRRAVPWGAAGALAAALAIAVALWAPWHHAPAPAPLRVSVELGTDASLAALNAQFGDAAIISPDGAVMAFVAQRDDEMRQLYVRRLDQAQATPLPGTEGALTPFFSPDGQSIGFFVPQHLMKIAVTGGAPMTLADAPSPRGGAWSEDGTVVFAPDQIAGTRLSRVSSAGGPAAPLTALGDGEAVHSWPQILPGGKALLYTVGSKPAAYNNANLVVERLPGGARTVVQRGGYHGRYLPSGHLVYIHDGTLFAVPFDLGRLEVTGPPSRALDGIRSNSITGGAQFTVSSSGTLLYLPGQMTGAGTPLHWMDRDGKSTTLRSTPENWMNLAFSPDGRRLATEIRDGSSDIWMLDVARDMLTRLTSAPGGAGHPAWTVDGRRLAFAAGRDTSVSNLYWQRADGAGEPQRLTTSAKAQRPFSWHPSGKFLAFDEETARSNVDVMILPIDGDDASGWKPGTPRAFLNSPAMESGPMFSPDGKWLAYASNESGPFEVYVRPFPGPGGKTQVSSGGGDSPMWSRTGREIVYGADGRLMVAAFTVDGETFRPAKPVPWPEGRYLTRGSNRPFDLHPDGERIALLPAAQTSNGLRPDKVSLVINFFDELRRIAPATKR